MRPVFFTGQERQQIDAVNEPVNGRVKAGRGEGGGEDVQRNDQMLTDFAGGHCPF
jgi:hypothetical protein